MVIGLVFNTCLFFTAVNYFRKSYCGCNASLNWVSDTVFNVAYAAWTDQNFFTVSHRKDECVILTQEPELSQSSWPPSDYSGVALRAPPFEGAVFPWLNPAVVKVLGGPINLQRKAICTPDGERKT